MSCTRYPLHLYCFVTCPICEVVTGLDQLNVGEPRCSGCGCFLVVQFTDGVLFALQQDPPESLDTDAQTDKLLVARTEATTIRLKQYKRDDA